MDYLYLTYNAPVNFGGGLVTASTPVNVEFLAFPVSIQSAMTNGLTFQSFFASDGAAGVLGVGPNAGGPGPSIPLQALPAPYNTAVGSFDQPDSRLVFEAPPGGGITTLTGSPITNLQVSVGGAAQNRCVDCRLRWCGRNFPVKPNAVPGEQITVRAPDGTLLDQYIYDGTYFPTPISSGLMNTGNLIFQQHPVYINYGADTLDHFLMINRHQSSRDEANGSVDNSLVSKSLGRCIIGL